ncbi:unnamed protein product [Macrosiphum euphorbiae]|uniref:Uncharacterized protein n=1 Tax=Macrosiphum euphorbiae TaxID=13131 RepID=A0AAV0VIX6_9HEMI|nr:unnamed protein product [Macrosiphum euphorbiae]
MCNSIKTLWRNIKCGHLFGHYRRSPELVKEQWPIRVTVIEGGDTGTAMFAAVRKIFKAAHVPVEWDHQTLSVYRDHNRLTVNPKLLNSAIETGLVLASRTTTKLLVGVVGAPQRTQRVRRRVQVQRVSSDTSRTVPST